MMKTRKRKVKTVSRARTTCTATRWKRGKKIWKVLSMETRKQQVPSLIKEETKRPQTSEKRSLSKQWSQVCEWLLGKLKSRRPMMKTLITNKMTLHRQA